MSTSPVRTNERRPPARCEVLLFHSALGLRPAVRRFAERLRAAGHVVHTPDLYDGEVFDDVQAGMAHVERIGGIDALMERTHAAVERLPRDLVYAGFSNGAGSAELLALTRDGARGAILMHGALPVEAFGVTDWPAAVPVQLHRMTGDPFADPEALNAFATSVHAAGAAFERYEYLGSGHLFADDELPEHDPAAAAVMLERVLAFLGRVAPRPDRDP